MAYRHPGRDNRNRYRRHRYEHDGPPIEDEGPPRRYRSRTEYFLSKYPQRNFLSGSSNEEWFRVTVPGVSGAEANRSQLCSMLNDRSAVPLNIYQFEYDEANKRVIFYISSRTEAFELRSISRRFTINNRNASIVVQRVSEPSFTLSGELLERMKRWMIGRYSEETSILSLGGVSKNEALRSEGIYLNLSRQSCLTLIVNVCEEMFPNATILDLRENHIVALDALRQRLPHVTRLNLEGNSIHRMKELDFIRHMQLVELSIGENPVCRQFSNFDDLSSVIRDRCPKLTILNGTTLPPRIGFAVDDEPITLPPSINFNVPDEYKDTIATFINRYFTCFDSTSADQRQALMDVYADDVILSFSVAWSSAYRPPYRFDRYSKEGRNFVKVIDDVARFDRLKRGKLEVISFLAKFPKTSHEISSFKVDLFALTANRLSLTISGVLAEDNSDLTSMPEKYRHQYRQFFRVFHCRPDKLTEFKIHAEHFSISEATQTQAKNAKLFMQQQQQQDQQRPSEQQQSSNELVQMVDKMVAASGMKLEFAKECLVANNWIFDNALRNYLELKSNNQIPEEAFAKKQET